MGRAVFEGPVHPYKVNVARFDGRVRAREVAPVKGEAAREIT